MNPEIEAHLRSLVNFPSPPGVATHIIELARDPDIEMGKVAKALSMDSALSTKILRIANSPLYAQRRKSENLRQALGGARPERHLDPGVELLAGQIAASGKAQRHQLSACIGAAPCSQRPPRARSPMPCISPMAEEIFLAALLQDVGILALDQGVPDLYTRRRSAAARSCSHSPRSRRSGCKPIMPKSAAG